MIDCVRAPGKEFLMKQNSLLDSDRKFDCRKSTGIVEGIMCQSVIVNVTIIEIMMMLTSLAVDVAAMIS